jgi:hypothetical protein
MKKKEESEKRERKKEVVAIVTRQISTLILGVPDVDEVHTAEYVVRNTVSDFRSLPVDIALFVNTKGKDRSRCHDKPLSRCGWL